VPTAEVSSPPTVPQGPPDWATPLFSEPAATTAPQESVRSEAAQSEQVQSEQVPDEPLQNKPLGSEPAQTPSDPFAPSAPSFAPSNGPFPPPGLSAPTAAQSPFFGAAETSPGSAEPTDPGQATDPAQTKDADALRALYSAAPAPTVPPADAPPPPGYESAAPAPQVPSVGSPSAPGDLRPRRRALPDDGANSGARSPIEELQAQLDERDREAREYEAWESSMLQVGTPEALAAVDEARAERSGAANIPSVPSAPSAPSAPTAEEPLAFLPPPFEEPTADFGPPANETAFDFAPPIEEPTADLAPPVDEPEFGFPPPAVEPVADLAPPADEPDFTFAPPVEEPTADLAPPADEPPFSFAPSVEESVADVAPPSEESPFGFAPPAEEPAADLAPPLEQPAAGLAPPAETHDFSFVAPSDVPSAPPPSNEATPFPGFGAPSDAPTTEFAAPSDPHELTFDSPPPLIQPPAPDGLADLWRDASEDVAPTDTPVAPSPQDAAASPPAAEPSAIEPSAGPPPAFEIPPPQPPAEAVTGFEDLLAGSGEPTPQAPSPGWIAPDANPSTEPDLDAAKEERRPFGEGVERDEAVDPSDSIFGSASAPVTVDTSGVAVLPRVDVVEPPISTLGASDELALAEEPATPVGPKISPPELVGLEPTPIEQRASRSARLFWLWFAANSSIAAVVFGTIIFALGVSLRQAIVATLAGVALSFIPLGLGTLAGKRSGQPTMVISRATFGVVGNILPAILALLSRLFWAAALLWVLGAGTAAILVGAKLTDGFTRDELTLIGIAIGFVLAVVIAYFGYALIAVIQLIVSVISGIGILGFIVLTWQYVNLTTALATPDGSWILVVTGAVLVFSFVGLAWANSSADLARYQRPDSSGAASMLWATFGVAIPSFLLIAYGALLAASNSTLAGNIASNPLDSLGRLLPVWYPVPLLVATGLSLLSGVVLAMYSGGFALQAAGLRLRRSLSTLLVGALVVIIALLLANTITDFGQLFREFATTIAVPIAAWAGLFGAEIMIRTRRFDATSLLKRGGVYEDARWGNLIALVIITIIGFGFLSATLPGLSWEGYLFAALGVPLNSQVATTDLGVLVALVLGLLVPLIAGHGGIARQEKATRLPE